VTAEGKPGVQLRGVDESRSHWDSLNTQYFEGYRPFLFPYRKGKNKRTENIRTIAPFNMVTRWAWKSGKTGETVPWDTMKSVYLEGSSYAADVLTLLDRDKNNTIGVHELVLDTEEKVRFIKTKLAAAGIEEPVIHGVIDAYKVNHGVVNLKQTKRDCSSCHSKGSRFGSPVVLSTRAPAGIVPEFQNSDGSAGSGIIIDGKVTISETGEVVLKRTRSPVGYYVFGHSRISVLDGLGFWIFLVSVLIVLIHGGIRYISSLRHPAPHVVTREVYMYRFYERLWHWTMATGVMLLAVTGLEVHYTGIFTLFGLETAVRLHNVLAAVLVINAVLSLFYHLVSGEIKQFFRFNRKFLQEVLVQVYFYVSGIFKRRPHPIGKTVERKLNPLQQLAYVGLLNVLLPFQVITGMLIWGVGQWPGLSDKLGGLTYLGPIHNFAAWLFLTFLVVHIYLTTTGHTVTSNLKAMIKGYDDVPEGETCDEHTALTDMRIMDLAGTLLGKLSKLKRRKGDKKGENERRKDDENDDE
ncbi:MAG: hypothetical protein GY940_48075, partial [bacterium]|nr:hypothetical protein [bacterium]